MQSAELFAERERAFEQLFKHDEELRFRVLVRRNKLLGRWAAETLGLNREEGEALTMDLVWRDADEGVPAEADLVRDLIAAFADRGRPGLDRMIRHQVAQFQREAWRQVMAE